MKKIFFLLLVFASVVQAQSNKYWIVFTDKNNSPYSIGTPSAYLSQRAIYRRAKYGIPVQVNDLPPNPAYIDSVKAKGAILFNRCGWLNAISISVTDTATTMPLIRRLPFVQSVRNVAGTNTTKGDSKIKASFSHVGKKQRKAVGMDSANYGAAYNQVHQIKADCLNEMGFRGKGKQIAIIDTRFGIADKLTAFDSIRKRGQILGTWDFVKEKTNVYDDSNNDNHGEAVLSCIASVLPGQIMGDAVDAGLYLLRTEDIYSEYMIEDDNWASAAEYADSAGADIISTSLGYSIFQDANTSYTYKDMNGRTTVATIAATIAAEKGMIVCVAAGNSGKDTWHYISSPADADSILTVGGVDGAGNYSSFSSTGPTADGRIKPDVVAQGFPVAVVIPTGEISADEGTSFATPITAGAVASLWQADTSASNMQVIDAVRKSASQYAHPDSLIGYGIPDYCLALKILKGITEDHSVTKLIGVFPNSFTDDVTVSFYASNIQKVTATLYNSAGQQLYQKAIKTAAGGNCEIEFDDLDDLPKGQYLIKIINAKGDVYTQKLVKQ